MPRGIPKSLSSNASDSPVFAAAPLASEFETTPQVARTLESIKEPGVIEKVADQPFDKDRMAMLAFMDESITIRIATSTDRNAEQVFELNINGHLEFFRRGETKTVKRYFVDR